MAIKRGIHHELFALAVSALLIAAAGCGSTSESHASGSVSMECVPCDDGEVRGDPMNWQCSRRTREHPGGSGDPQQSAARRGWALRGMTR